MSFYSKQFDSQPILNMVKFLDFYVKYKSSDVGKYYYNNNLLEWFKKLLI